jgi:hypothetical protein
MGELVFCPVCKISAVVVWLSPIVLEDASQMYAESERSVTYNRSKARSRHRSSRDLDEDRDDFGFGRKRRGFDSDRKRQGNRTSRYYED